MSAPVNRARAQRAVKAAKFCNITCEVPLFEKDHIAALFGSALLKLSFGKYM